MLDAFIAQLARLASAMLSLVRRKPPVTPSEGGPRPKPPHAKS